QSDFRTGDHGNLEAILFRDGALHHLFGSGRDHGVVWENGQTLPSPASGPGSIIQSDFGGSEHGNFEVVLWTGTEIWHYWHDNSDVSRPWQRAQTITIRAASHGSIIQGPFGGAHKNFEVVVLEGNELVHYFHDNSDVSLPWQRGQVVSVAATGAGCIVKS